MEAIHCSETSINLYQNIWHDIPPLTRDWMNIEHECVSSLCSLSYCSLFRNSKFMDILQELQTLRNRSEIRILRSSSKFYSCRFSDPIQIESICRQTFEECTLNLTKLLTKTTCRNGCLLLLNSKSRRLPHTKPTAEFISALKDSLSFVLLGMSHQHCHTWRDRQKKKYKHILPNWQEERVLKALRPSRVGKVVYKRGRTDELIKMQIDKYYGVYYAYIELSFIFYYQQYSRW
jgi:hypothetical protein